MKITSSQIKKLNKLSKKKPIMVRVNQNWYTWAEGDPKYGVFLTSQSGDDVEFDFKQIDDIQESKMVKMKSKLREIIREEIQKLNEARLKDIVPDIIFIAAQYTRRNLDHIARQSWSSSADLIKQISDDYLGHSSKKHFERDVNKLLKKHSIREETLNEKKWDISQKTQGGTDFRNTMAFHSRELQKVVSLYRNRRKVDKEEMKYYMNIWMTGFHQRLKSLGVL
jgi:hypothetical protein